MSREVLQERRDESALKDGRQRTGNAVGCGKTEAAEVDVHDSGLYL